MMRSLWEVVIKAYRYEILLILENNEGGILPTQIEWACGDLNFGEWGDYIYMPGRMGK